jgi:hypothetical protein
LLEFSGVPFELDVQELNERWSHSEYIYSWSQLVIKHTGKEVAPITAAPRSGFWELMEYGSVEFVRPQTHRRTVLRQSRGFFLRIANKGDWFYEGADLGILVTPGRLMTKGFTLTQRAKSWIKGIKNHYEGGSASAKKVAAVSAQVLAADFKLI